VYVDFEFGDGSIKKGGVVMQLGRGPLVGGSLDVGSPKMEGINITLGVAPIGLTSGRKQRPPWKDERTEWI